VIAWMRALTYRGRHHRRRSAPVHPWLVRHFIEPSQVTPHAL
jgi:hypothetical protein